jgi:hypothetical protein
VSARTLLLEIVTPDGMAVSEEGVDTVVLRRQEPGFDAGGEVAVFPLHAPMLVRLALAPLRYRKRDETVHLAVAGGFAEVNRDRVLVVTPRCEPVPPGTGGPAVAAAGRCREWARAMGEFRAEMAGAGSLVRLPTRPIPPPGR